MVKKTKKNKFAQIDAPVPDRKPWLIGGLECDSEDSQESLARRILRDVLAVDPSDGLDVVKAYKRFIMSEYSDLTTLVREFCGDSADLVLSYIEYNNADAAKTPITLASLFLLPKQREVEDRSKLSTMVETYKGGRRAYEQSYGMPERIISTVLPDGSIRHQMVDAIPDHTVRGFEPDLADQRVGVVIPAYRPDRTNTVTYGQYYHDRTGHWPSVRGQWDNEKVLEIYLVTPKARYLAMDVLIDFRIAADRARADSMEARELMLPNRGQLFLRSQQLYERWLQLRKAMSQFIWDSKTCSLQTVTVEEDGRLKAFYETTYKGWSLRSPIIRAELSPAFLEAERKFNWSKTDQYWVHVQRLAEIDAYLEDHPSDDFVRDVFEVELTAIYRLLCIDQPWHLFRNKWKGSLGYMEPWRRYVLRLTQPRFRPSESDLDAMDEWIMNM